MKKMLQRTLAAIACACTLSFPLQAFAAGGVTETANTSTATTVDERGNTVVTVTIQKTAAGTDENGVQVDRQETRTDTTVTDRNGNEIGSTWTEDGSEKLQWETEVEPGQDLPDADVTLIPGKDTTGSASESTTEEVDGYQQTTTTDRTVSASTSEAEIKANDSNTGLVGDAASDLKAPVPVYDENDNPVYGSNGKLLDAYGKDGLFDRNYLSQTNSYANPDNWNMPEGAELRYIGTGEHSKYFVGFMEVVYKKNADGSTVYDENGEPVIEALLDSSGGPITIDGVPATELLERTEYDGYSGSRAQTFMLMDKDGNKLFGYCADIGTGANTGYWYSITNLEDSEYYASEESENHIRNIVLNGYWGTSDVAKEDGTYETGSLEGIKAKLRAAVNNGELNATVPLYKYDTATKGRYVLDENGDPIVEGTVNILDILDGMTEGEALLATQAAIWSYSNGMHNVENGKDGRIVVSPDWYRNHQANYSKHEKEPLDAQAGARVEFLYNWLINLDAEQDSTVVINDQNFISDMSLTVGDKVGTEEGTDNGIYETALNFRLAFMPGANDDLLVQISYTDLDGNPVNLVRRLAGANAEGENYGALLPDADGNYVIPGLKLSENKDFDFDLRLEGTQYLEQGVYVYTAVGGRETSQSFVGLAEGTRNVDVSMGLTIRFEVDEKNTVVAEREWHDEGDPIATPPPPQRYRLTLPRGGNTTIPDEPVPLAEAPETGDNSWILLAVAALAAAGLGATYIADKKKRTQA